MKPTAVIFDVDGTLCDVTGIRHLVASSSSLRNFDHFHRASIFSPPHDYVLDELHKALADGHHVFIVTARNEKWLELTVNWLGHVGAKFHEVHARGLHDHRPDREVKLDILNKIRETHDVVHAWDDNPAVVALWTEQGIPVTVVPGWAD